MEYKVIQVKGNYESKYPDSRKYVFRVEGYDHDLSGFSKFPVKEGDTVNGDITVNGQYHNFKFGSKGGAKSGGLPANLEAMLISASRESYSANANIIALTKRLEEAGVIKPFAPKVDYPPMEKEPEFGADEVPF